MTRAELPATIRNPELIEEWFGYFSDFHDCRIAAFDWRPPNAIIEIEAFRMTEEVDEAGYLFVTDMRLFGLFVRRCLAGNCKLAKAQSLTQSSFV